MARLWRSYYHEFERHPLDTSNTLLTGHIKKAQRAPDSVPANRPTFFYKTKKQAMSTKTECIACRESEFYTAGRCSNTRATAGRCRLLKPSSCSCLSCCRPAGWFTRTSRGPESGPHTAGVGPLQTAGSPSSRTDTRGCRGYPWWAVVVVCTVFLDPPQGKITRKKY